MFTYLDVVETEGVSGCDYEGRYCEAVGGRNI